MEAPEQYRYANAVLGHHHTYLLPTVDAALMQFAPRSVFDLGCGNGSVAHHLSYRYEIAGIDASETGIATANKTWPHLRLEVGSVYEDLASRFGAFDAVVSLEVVEHLYDPRLYAGRLFDLVRPGGSVVVSTPYHGYWKNLALAVTGRMDNHFTALWHGGHIKFWSMRTLSVLLTEAGFRGLQFHFVGRIPFFAKSMIAIASRPN